MLRHSDLDKHVLKEGKFITPFNNAFGDTLEVTSWVNQRLPEYLWLGLILSKFGRKKGIQKIHTIYLKIDDYDPQFNLPFFSNLLCMDINAQKEIWKSIKSEVGQEALEPLTIVYSFRDYPDFNREFQGNMGVSQCVCALQDVLEKSMDKGSEFATDIQFCVLFHQNLRIKYVMEKSTADLLMIYPALEHSDETMRLVRPLVRSLETSTFSAMTKEGTNELNQSAMFWERISVMTDCQLLVIPYSPGANNAKLYIEYLQEIFKYLDSSFVSTEPLNKKHLVILGMSTYAFKRIKELVEHNLFNEISGRSIIRNIIEIYIMLKYLLKHESEKQDIWNDYQYYGMGQYKLIVERNRSNPCTYTDGHVNYKMLELLVHEYYNEELLDMDTRYFDSKQIRKKAEDVNEKELFGLFYDYDSSFEHGLWGAVRESSLLACGNPAHQFHNVLDSEDSQKLPSVWKDCVRTMNKILTIVNGEISIPTKLMDEVKAFE